MLNPQTLNLIFIACPVLMIGCAFVCLIFLRKARSESRQAAVLVAQLENEISELSRDLDTVSQRATTQDRRVAWLESRVRNSKVAAPAEETVEQLSGKPTITERRHRVIQLTRRG